MFTLPFAWPDLSPDVMLTFTLQVPGDSSLKGMSQPAQLEVDGLSAMPAVFVMVDLSFDRVRVQVPSEISSVIVTRTISLSPFIFVFNVLWSVSGAVFLLLVGVSYCLGILSAGSGASVVAPLDSSPSALTSGLLVLLLLSVIGVSEPADSVKGQTLELYAYAK